MVNTPQPLPDDKEDWGEDLFNNSLGNEDKMKEESEEKELDPQLREMEVGLLDAEGKKIIWPSDNNGIEEESAEDLDPQLGDEEVSADSLSEDNFIEVDYDDDDQDDPALALDSHEEGELDNFDLFLDDNGELVKQDPDKRKVNESQQIPGEIAGEGSQKDTNTDNENEVVVFDDDLKEIERQRAGLAARFKDFRPEKYARTCWYAVNGELTNGWHILGYQKDPLGDELTYVYKRTANKSVRAWTATAWQMDLYAELENMTEEQMINLYKDLQRTTKDPELVRLEESNSALPKGEYDKTAQELAEEKIEQDEWFKKEELKRILMQKLPKERWGELSDSEPVQPPPTTDPVPAEPEGGAQASSNLEPTTPDPSPAEPIVAKEPPSLMAASRPYLEGIWNLLDSGVITLRVNGRYSRENYWTIQKITQEIKCFLTDRFGHSLPVEAGTPSEQMLREFLHDLSSAGLINIDNGRLNQFLQRSDCFFEVSSAIRYPYLSAVRNLMHCGIVNTPNVTHDRYMAHILNRKIRKMLLDRFSSDPSGIAVPQKEILREYLLELEKEGWIVMNWLELDDVLAEPDCFDALRNWGHQREQEWKKCANEQAVQWARLRDANIVEPLSPAITERSFSSVSEDIQKANRTHENDEVVWVQTFWEAFDRLAHRVNVLDPAGLASLRSLQTKPQLIHAINQLVVQQQQQPSQQKKTQAPPNQPTNTPKPKTKVQGGGGPQVPPSPMAQLAPTPPVAQHAPTPTNPPSSPGTNTVTPPSGGSSSGPSATPASSPSKPTRAPRTDPNQHARMERGPSGLWTPSMNGPLHERIRHMQHRFAGGTRDLLARYFSQITGITSKTNPSEPLPSPKVDNPTQKKGDEGKSAGNAQTGAKN